MLKGLLLFKILLWKIALKKNVYNAAKFLLDLMNTNTIANRFKFHGIITLRIKRILKFEINSTHKIKRILKCETHIFN